MIIGGPGASMRALTLDPMGHIVKKKRVFRKLAHRESIMVIALRVLPMIDEK